MEKCDNCGKLIHNSISDGDIKLCKKCYEKYYIFCFYCGVLIKKEDKIAIKNIDICNKCFKKYFMICKLCGNPVIGLKTGLCQECFNEYYATCSHCKMLFKKSDMAYVKIVNSDNYEDYVCNSCLKDYYSKCDNCKVFDNILFMYKVGNEYLCSKCFDKGLTVKESNTSKLKTHIVELNKLADTINKCIEEIE